MQTSQDEDGVDADVTNITPQTSQDESLNNGGADCSSAGGDNPSAFFSDPSVSPEEEMGSSIDDRRKKQIYRQHLQYAAGPAAAVAAERNRRNSTGDAGSVGDTSLSSTNLSPLPERNSFDIQFFNERQRNKIKAAARSTFMRFTTSETSSGGISGLTSENDPYLLEAALLPPSTTMSTTADATGQPWESQSTLIAEANHTKSNDRPSAKFHQENENGLRLQPDLDSVDDSLLRGMDITSEQSGGESSSSIKIMTSNTTTTKATTPSLSSRQRVGGEKKKKLSPLSSPETDVAKRLRRGHERRRSGDLVAATYMNPGGKDWIGMNRDNLPLPDAVNDDEEDDDGSSMPPSTPISNQQRNQNARTSPSSTGEKEKPHHQRIFSPDSSEFYDFSDSSISNSIAHQRNHQQHQQQHLFHFQHTAFDDPMHHRGQQYNNGMTMYSNAYHPHFLFEHYYPMDKRYPNHYRHHSNSRDDLENNGRLSYRRQIESEDSGSYSSGSGEGENSTTSSSYMTDDAASHSTKSQSSRSSHHNETPSHPFSISGHSKSHSLDVDQPPELAVNESSDSKFDQIMKRVTRVLDVPLYGTKVPKRYLPDDEKYPTFFCPNCKTKQRAFLSVATASDQHSSPLGYLALYFALYMVSSLFIFGLEEGWQPLDCVYFSVITLTTAGLGDFVPTTDGAKIVCACFIYVGVATIGLLLGSLLAGSLDDATRKDAHDAQVKDCPNCQRLERLKSRVTTQQGTRRLDSQLRYSGSPPYYGYVEVGEAAEQSSATSGSDASLSEDDPLKILTPRNSHTRHMSLANPNDFSLKSQQQKTLSNILPMNSALRRKSHTRHMSLANSLTQPARCKSPDELGKIDESTPLMETTKHRSSEDIHIDKAAQPQVRFCEESSYSTTSSDTSSLKPSEPLTRLKAAKYIFLTLNQALANSVFIIAAGSIGFYYIEDMSAVDSFYFTTVLLTSVGYGDIVPVTAAGKMFTTVFIIVAGTILLHNMTLISMIPLQLRKRRIEQAVLGQFGDRLTDDELRELSTGTLVNRLKLATNRPDGLDECTREMFSLAMLVRLGRVTEEDVKATFAAFRRLDVGNYGRLNSRSIIEGELMRRRALNSKLAAMSDWEGQSPSIYSQGDSYSQGLTYGFYPPPPSHGPMPTYSPSNYSPGMYGSTPRSQGSTLSDADHFNFEEYEQWASNWNHYDTLKNHVT